MRGLGCRYMYLHKIKIDMKNHKYFKTPPNLKFEIFVH